MSYLVGITGPSAAGKTYVLQQLTSSFSTAELTLISMDNYYQELAHQPKDEQGDYLFDHPDSLELGAFTTDLDELLSGNTIQRRQYTFNNPALPSELITYLPAPIVVVEGIFALYPPQLRARYELKIFIEAEPHVLFARRLRRDMAERGYSFDYIIDDYERHVAPMYKQFVEPFRQEAHLILVNNQNTPLPGVQVIVHHLRHVLSAR